MKTITNLNQIDSSSPEGILARAAIALLWTRYETGKTPDEIIKLCNDLEARVYAGIGKTPDEAVEQYKEYLKEKSGV